MFRLKIIIKKFLPKNIENILRRFIAILNYIINYKFLRQEKKEKLFILSDEKDSTFFGYHDKTPFSNDNSKILAMSVKADDDKPKSECTPMKIGYFTKDKNKFISLTQTTTWCWQQGCMLQWNPINPDKEIFFNALVNGKYGSRMFDIEKKKIIYEYSYPIYAISPSGLLAVTLNFSRLGRLRPGYGYNLLPDNTSREIAPKNDGLFVFDLKKNERKLLVSLSELAKDVRDLKSQHYINHATFSPDNKRILFFHLWSEENDKNRHLRVCEFNLITGKWREIEQERTVSHYCWKNENVFLATTLEKSGKWHYTLYNLANNTRTDLDLSLKGDGHPMFHPLDKNIFVTDTYPDIKRDQNLFIVNLNTKKIKKIATFYTSFKYKGQVRCDLHPRWDRKGKFVIVDNTQYNRRSMALIKTEYNDKI